MTQPELEKLAASLSEAQRADILAAQATYQDTIRVWSRDLRTAKAIERKGLSENLSYSGGATLAPLGLALRKYLKEQER